jgi:hypothetical protein
MNHNEYEIKTMKTNLKKLATATLMLLAVATVQAQPIVLPDPATSTAQTGTFTVDAKSQLTLTGNAIVLTTSLPSSGDIASGSAHFKSGDLQYKDGASSLDGKIAKVSFGRQIKDGQVVYLLQGLVYGKLSQAGQTIDVNGNFSVTTKTAPESTTLGQAQLDNVSLILTTRSNVNNTQPVNPHIQQHGHNGGHSKH